MFAGFPPSPGPPHKLHWSLSISIVGCRRVTTCLVCVAQPSHRCLLNSEITSEKPKRVNSLTPTRWWKRHLFTAWMETRRQCVALFHLSQWESGGPILAALHVWMTTKEPKILILGLQIKFYWVDGFANTKSMNNEDGLFIEESSSGSGFFSKMGPAKLWAMAPSFEGKTSLLWELGQEAGPFV